MISCLFVISSVSSGSPFPFSVGIWVTGSPFLTSAAMFKAGHNPDTSVYFVIEHAQSCSHVIKLKHAVRHVHACFFVHVQPAE